VKIDRGKLRKTLRPFRDAEWTEVSIDGVQGNNMDWIIVLKSEEEKLVKVGITIPQVSYLLPAMRDLSEEMLFATPYQTIDRLAQAFGAHSTAVVLDTNLDRIVGGRVEMKMVGGKRIYLQMSAGDAIVYAVTMSLPMYMTKGIVNYLSER
jgi:hypothetical protein